MRIATSDNLIISQQKQEVTMQYRESQMMHGIHQRYISLALPAGNPRCLMTGMKKPVTGTGFFILHSTPDHSLWSVSSSRQSPREQ